MTAIHKNFIRPERCFRFIISQIAKQSMIITKEISSKPESFIILWFINLIRQLIFGAKLVI